MRAPTACFFARVRDPKLFDLVEFYRADIRVLGDLGFRVVTARRWSEVPARADLYFTWWWGPGGLTLTKSLPARRPNIFTGNLHMGADDESNRWRQLGPVKRGLVHACLRLASANLATSDVELAHLRRIGAPRLERVYHGIDADVYRPGEAPHRDREKLVLSLSHLTAENVARKCLESVIRAVPLVTREHPEARFVVAGAHESGYVRLRDLAASLGVASSVEFPGRVSHEEKLALYHRARVFAQPTRFEGFGVAHAEAMACGLAVVTSPRGAIPEVVGPCGRMVNPDDPERLAEEIVDLLAHPADGQRLGQSARERVVARFSYAARREAIGAVVDRVLGRTHGTPPKWRMDGL